MLMYNYKNWSPYAYVYSWYILSAYVYSWYIFHPKIVYYAKAGYDKFIYVHSYLTRINPNSWEKTLTELYDFEILAWRY